MWSHLKFTYKVPNWTAPNQITLYQTSPSQTMACITKSSLEISSSQTLCKHWVVIPFWHFGRTNHFHLEGSKIQKEEYSTTEVNWQKFLFWGLVHHLIISNKKFQKPALFLFSGKDAPNLVEPLNWASLHLWAP